MNKPSDKLFLLITMMSDDEKKYFRKFCVILKQVNHISTTRLLHLFDAINQLKTYDEPKLKRKVAGTISENSFKIYKAELKNIVLSSLEALGSRDTENVCWRKRMNRVELFTEAGMPTEALKLLAELKDLTGFDFDSPEVLHQLEALKAEKNILLKNFDPNSIRIEQIDRIAIQQSELLYVDHAAETHLLILHNLCAHHLLLNKPGEQHLFNSAIDNYRHFIQQNKKCYRYYRIAGGLPAALLAADFNTYFNRAISAWEYFTNTENLNYHMIKYFPHWYSALFSHAVNAGMLTRNPAALEKIITLAEKEYQILFQKDTFLISVMHCAKATQALHENNTTTLQQYAKLVAEQAAVQTGLGYLRYMSTLAALIYYRLKNYKAAIAQTIYVINTNPHNSAYIHCRDFCCLFRFVTEHDNIKENNIEDQRTYYSALEALQLKLQRDSQQVENTFQRCIVHYLQNPSPATRNHCLAELNLLRHTTTARHFNALFDFEQWLRSR